MATSSYARTLLGGLQPDLKEAIGKVVDYILTRNLAFGPIDSTDAQSKTENFRGRYVPFTTSGTAGQEASATHGLGRVPSVVWQVVSPTVVNARFIGDLTVSRAADVHRVYFSSASSTGAVTILYVE